MPALDDPGHEMALSETLRIITVRKAYLDARHLGLPVRESECAEVLPDRDGAKRKLDHLLTIIRGHVDAAKAAAKKPVVQAAENPSITSVGEKAYSLALSWLPVSHRLYAVVADANPPTEGRAIFRPVDASLLDDLLDAARTVEGGAASRVPPATEPRADGSDQGETEQTTEQVVDDDPTETASGGMKWQEAADRMERLRKQGVAFTSQHALAKSVGCSSGTINKAIRNTLSLRPWAKPQPAPRAEQSLDNEEADIKKDLAQHSEPDPAGGAADAELRAVFENADPEERAFLNEITGASPQFMLWYIEQTAPRRKACRDQWAKTTASDPTVKVWFLGLTAADQLAYFDDPGSHPINFPRP
jgi:hypothetical protein